ncbi:MAG: hypothetical protein IKN54_06230 [Lachnospiraceae bacterium]|nr:hypothetical protein [Lachnospiraceae bacterium]
MLNVSAATKTLLKGDSVYKEMTVVLYSVKGTRLTFNNDKIYYESFELSESILDGSNMTFMGCISNEMRVTLRNDTNMREDAFNGSPVTVTVTPYFDNNGVKTAGDTIPLFSGYVDNGAYDHDKSYLKITAYDVLYYLKGINIWNWYRTEFSGGAKTLSTVLSDFASWVDTNSGYDFELSQSRCPVILDVVKIKKRLNNKQMTAADFLKSFCQLSCACAIIDRTGKLQLIYLNSLVTQDEIVEYYRSLTSKDYVIQPFTEGITIRTNSDDNGVTLTAPTTITVDWNDDSNDTYIIDDDDVAVSTGRYFIENNGLVKKLSKRKREAIINILLNNVQNSYYTFKSYTFECNGLPYVECGDRIGYQKYTDTTENFDANKELTVDNTDGAETPVTITITFTNNYAATPSTSIIVRNSATTGDNPTIYLDIYDALVGIGYQSYGIAAGDKITFYKYNGTTEIKYYKDDEVHDISQYQHSGYPDYDLKLEAGVSNAFELIMTLYQSCTATLEYSGLKNYYFIVANRKLKGIQSMIDTFSFDLPNTLQEYGGTTSGLTDTNIAAESSTTSEQLTGEEVMTVVSFVNGVLTTTSKKI